MHRLGVVLLTAAASAAVMVGLTSTGQAAEPSSEPPVGDQTASHAVQEVQSQGHERVDPLPGGAGATARTSATEFVAQNPATRVICEKADGTFTVIIGRRVDPNSDAPMSPPAGAGCRR